MRRIPLLLVGLGAPLLAMAADPESGREKARACTACHGANGVSVSDDIPNLAGQKSAYLKAQLRAFRDGTRKNTLMNAMASQLGDADIDNLVAFFQGLTPSGESEASPLGRTLGKSKISFPEDYRESFVLYSKIDQAGPKRVRHNFANDAAMRGPDSAGIFPDGAFVLTEIYSAKLDEQGNPVKGDDGHFQAGKLLVLAAMEKRTGWGDEIPTELRNGNWNYALFTPGKAHREINQAKCLACHKPLDGEDYLFSYRALVQKTR